MNPNTK